MTADATAALPPERRRPGRKPLGSDGPRTVMLSLKITPREGDGLDNIVSKSRLPHRGALIRSWVELALGGVLVPVEAAKPPESSQGAIDTRGPVAIGRAADRSLAGRARWLLALVEQPVTGKRAVEAKDKALSRAAADLGAVLDGIPVADLVQEYVDELVADLDEPRLRGLAGTVEEALDVVRRRCRQADLDAAGPLEVPSLPTVPCPTCQARAGGPCVDKKHRPCAVHPARVAEQQRQLVLLATPAAKPANDRDRDAAKLSQEAHDDITERAIALVGEGSVTETEIVAALQDELDDVREVLADLVRTGAFELVDGAYRAAPEPEEELGPRADPHSPDDTCPITWGDVLGLAKRLRMKPHEGANSALNVWGCVKTIRALRESEVTRAAIYAARPSAGTDSLNLAIRWLMDRGEIEHVSGKPGSPKETLRRVEPTPDFLEAQRKHNRQLIRTFVLGHITVQPEIGVEAMARAIDEMFRAHVWYDASGQLRREALQELVNRGALDLRDGVYHRLDPKLVPCSATRCGASAGTPCIGLEDGRYHQPRIHVARKQPPLLRFEPTTIAEAEQPRGGAWSTSRRAVRCDACGETWPRDPALEVPCPRCHRRVGVWCKSPSGHKAMQLHTEREKAVLAAGKLHVCPNAPPEGA